MSSANQPQLIVLAGPNGAGKSTAAPELLRGILDVNEFVNADTIARGLSAFAPERVAQLAGRVMLNRLKQLAAERSDFAFETTLASRSFATWIEDLRKQGYLCHLLFLWLPSVEQAVARVEERVRMGGHDVPEETIRRRYKAGVRNFFELYRPISDTWRMYDNVGASLPRLIASGCGTIVEVVADAAAWAAFEAEGTK